MLALALLLGLVAAPARVNGFSMFPTLNGGDLLLLEKYPRHRESFPKRGDIIVFRGDPANPYAWELRHWLGLEWKTRPAHIKRVIALAGDTVSITEGQVRVNGLPTPEWGPPGFLDDLPPQRVPPGRLWVMGDNHQVGASLDSRTYGPVRREDALGLVRWRLWPRPGQVK